MPSPGQQARNLTPKSISRFRGISQYRSIVGQPMEWAQDCMNVIVGGAGFLEKIRAKIAKSNANGVLGIIDRMYDFQQAIGTRQLFVNQGNTLGYFTEPVIGAPFVWTPIETQPIDSSRWSFIDSNNLLFMGNGKRMLKWTGAQLQNWGIVPPVTAPTMGVRFPNLTIQRAANVITVFINPAGFPTNNNFNPAQLNDVGLQVGDMVIVDGVIADPAANGRFAITGTGGALSFTYASVGANFGPVAQGNSTLASVAVFNFGGSADFKVTGVIRINGTVTVSVINNFRVQPGDQFTMTGWSGSAPAFPLFNGTFQCTASDAASVSFFLDGPDIPATVVGPTLPVMVGGFTDALSPRTWRYTYGNSVTGEESVASPSSEFVPNSTQGLVANIRTFLTAIASPDPQVDTIYWYASLDGGQDWFLDFIAPLNVYGLFFSDGHSDNVLDVTQRANFINFPPPISTKLSKWQGRIYMVPNSNPQSIVYTGYEKILRGRPESSVPPGNQIQMQVGAAAIKGHGPLMNGVVIWDNNDKMFMFKGTVEDIVSNQPVNYSEQLEEMPWQTGVTSHESIQSTPKGVMWFGSDYAIHKWNGIFYGEIIGPMDLTQNISPLLKRITDGTAPLIQSEYFNFLERDWYVALICVDGSQYYNRILFLDVAEDANDNLGIFVSDIQADSIAVRVDANEIRHLLVSVHGIVYEIKAASTATAGVHKNITSSNQLLDAFWLSGYDGNEDAITMKMYRWGRLIVDQDGFDVLVTLIDDETSTLANPILTYPFPGLTQQENKWSVNWKAKRMSVQINFPQQDVDASVLQLITTHIPLSER